MLYLILGGERYTTPPTLTPTPTPLALPFTLLDYNHYLPLGPHQPPQPCPQILHDHTSHKIAR